jgi:hypothetical protein
MRKRKFLVGVVLSVIGALVVSGTASATVVSQTFTSTVKPPKQKKKVFGPVKSFANVIDRSYAPGGFTPNAVSDILTFSKDIKFTPGNLPQCQLSQVNNQKKATAQANCGSSIVGTGSAGINGGALIGTVTAFNGAKSGANPTIYLHTAITTPSGAEVLDPTLVGVLNTKANTLSVTVPPTGTSITHFDVTIPKKKTGKKSFYVTARCRKGKWISTDTTTFSDGSTKTGTSKQKCKGV